MTGWATITPARLVQLRTAAELTQTALADRCARAAGGTPAHWRIAITRAESGARDLTEYQRTVVLRALGVGDAAAAALEGCRAELVAEGRIAAVVALRSLADAIEAGR